MKILLIAVGTRGDVEPFLAIAELLQARGHEITCCFPEQFRSLADDSRFEFFGLSAAFLDLIGSDDGKMAMGGKGSFFKKIGAYFRLYKEGSRINKILCEQQYELIRRIKPDRIVYHIKAMYPLIWETQNVGKTILVSPIPYIIHPVDNHAHVGLGNNLGKFINQLTYSVANYGLLKNVLSVTKAFRGSPKISSQQVGHALKKTKMIYTVSPFIFSKPASWPDHVNILGYHERNKMVNWEADERLKKFIATHNKLLFVTFGSMVNDAPQQKTKIILDILHKNKIPAIINIASGGLVQPEQYDTDLFYFVNRIPYEWVFPKIHAVIHHGGSGTTHMAIKYGCSSLIIPHIIDQFLWNDLVRNLNLGPKGIAMKNLTHQKIGSLIVDLYNNDSYKKNTLQLAKKMNKEDFKETLYEIISKET